MQSNEEKRGHELIAKAEAALKRFTIFSSTSKYEDAVSFYQKAANNFKMAKKWQDAGNAYKKCAECEVKLKSMHEAATHYVAAADMYRRIEPASSISLYQQAISMFCEMGRFSSAAKHCEMIGELYDKDNNVEQAVAFYQQAGDYYMGEDASSRAGKCFEKVAKHAATLSKYDKAAETFENLASTALESNLLKFNAKKHFLHAGVCHLARGDLVASKQSIEQFKDQDYTFGDSRECKLLENILAAYEDYDIDAFADHLYAYDSVSPLDPWLTSILLRVKNSITEASEEAPDLS